MRYSTLASDYDGTLAHDGRVHPTTLAALERLKQSGRRLILVTGREIDDLLRVFPAVDMCDLVVAENGALLYNPRNKQETILGPIPSPEFIAALKKRGVQPLAVGRVIVATWRPHDSAVLEVIREQKLQLQLIYNKDAVMILPPGIHKASGLQAALDHLGLNPAQTVGVGDAENDHALLSLCGISVAVANALPSLKKEADLVTTGDHGKGVTELIETLIESDLAGIQRQPRGHDPNSEREEHHPELR